MGGIISVVEAIEALRFRPIKKGMVARGVDVLQGEDGVALVRHPDGSVTVIGTHASHVNGNVAILGYGATDGHSASRAVLDGLVRLGVLTAEHVRTHVARVDERRKERAAKDAAQRLGRVVEDLGVDVVRQMLDQTYGLDDRKEG